MLKSIYTGNIHAKCFDKEGVGRNNFVKERIMEKKQIRAISIIIAVLLALAILFNIYLLIAYPVSAKQVIYHIALCLAALAAVIYIFLGAQKLGAGFFKLFLILFAVASLVGTFLSKSLGIAPNLVTYVAVLSGIMAVCGILLTFVKDLGYVKSLVIALVAIFCGFLRFFAGASRSLIEYTYASSSTVLLMTLAILMLVLAKYYDKEERGRAI